SQTDERGDAGSKRVYSFDALQTIPGLSSSEWPVAIFRVFISSSHKLQSSPLNLISRDPIIKSPRHMISVLLFDITKTESRETMVQSEFLILQIRLHGLSRYFAQRPYLRNVDRVVRRPFAPTASIIFRQKAVRRLA